MESSAESIPYGKEHPRPSRSRRRQLQAQLGELGTVLERQAHGTPDRPAAGWYAELLTGELVYLGDYAAIAFGKIGEIRAGYDEAANA